MWLRETSYASNKGGNGLKLQSSVKLDSHNLGLHCFREDIAKILVLI